jgi:hypothetical protein
MPPAVEAKAQRRPSSLLPEFTWGRGSRFWPSVGESSDEEEDLAEEGGELPSPRNGPHQVTLCLSLAIQDFVRTS